MIAKIIILLQCWQCKCLEFNFFFLKTNCVGILLLLFILLQDFNRAIEQTVEYHRSPFMFYFRTIREWWWTCIFSSSVAFSILGVYLWKSPVRSQDRQQCYEFLPSFFSDCDHSGVYCQWDYLTGSVMDCYNFSRIGLNTITFYWYVQY